MHPIALALTSLSLLIAASHTLAANSDNPQAKAFIEQTVKKYKLDRGYVVRTLNKARRRQDIIDLMNRPAEAKPWYKYRPIFVTSKRAKAGAEYWARNKATLAKAQRKYGVPPEIIVAIIGVETYYGRLAGSHRVLDALYTLGFHYPKRGKLFRSFMAEYLAMVKEEELDPTELVGSYAGAMGRPQFMPSSYRAYAVDGNGDGKRDIWEEDADVIFSVANYFKRHKWKRGGAVAIPAKANDKQHKPLAKRVAKPDHTLGELKAKQVKVDTRLGDNVRAALIRLDQPDGPEYWVGFGNFYTITRYNHSNLYAMAVLQLSQAILDEWEKGSHKAGGAAGQLGKAKG